MRWRSGVSGSAAAIARRFIRAPRRHPAGSSHATSGWFETLRLYRDSAFAGATGEAGEREEDDRRPTALRARPPRGAPRPRACGLREVSVGRVVVVMPASQTSWDTEARTRTGLACRLGPGWQPAALARVMHQPGLAEWSEDRLVWPAGVKDDGWRWGRVARLRVWPRPSPSRIFDRYAAPSASLTASLWHGIGSWRGRPGACLSMRRATLYSPGVSSGFVPPTASSKGESLRIRHVRRRR